MGERGHRAKPGGVAAGESHYNDIPAFSMVGTSIAVANAKQAVLDAATTTTTRHHDDGVAAYLEAWLAKADNQV